MAEPEETIKRVLGDPAVLQALHTALKLIWTSGRDPEVILDNEFQDDLVKQERLTGAVDTTGVVVAQGYLGELIEHNRGGSLVRYQRLYTSPDLTNYVEIPDADIVLRVDLRTPFDSFAGQAVWVNGDAQVLVGSRGVQKQAVQGGLLSGDITQGNGARGWPGGASPNPWCSGTRGWPGGASPNPWCSGTRGWPGGASPNPWCSG